MAHVAEFKKTGWYSAPYRADAREFLSRAATKKEHFLDVARKAVQRTFSIQYDRFDPQYAREIEIEKSIARGLLRYDADSLNFIQQGTRQLCEELQLGDQAKWVTLPYPIIHLPQDRSEPGLFHEDHIHGIEHFLTIWSPLNDCFGKPISIVPGSHIKQKQTRMKRMLAETFERVFSRRPPAIPLRFRAISPTMAFGGYMSWYSRTLHKGNLNRTDDTTVALVVRVTDTPILQEPTVELKKLWNSGLIPEPDVDASAFADQFTAWVARIRDSSANLQALSFMEAVKKIDTEIAHSKDSEPIRKRLSFAMTLYAQRLGQATDAWIYHLCALLLANDNLHSLVKIREHLEASEKHGEFYAFYLERNPSAQAASVVLSGSKKDGMPKRWSEPLPLQTW